jgi:hypothetical protein
MAYIIPPLFHKFSRYKYQEDPSKLGSYLPDSSFIPSETFEGPREGYVYTSGPSGIGYYLNRPPVPDKKLPPYEIPTGVTSKLTSIWHMPREEIQKRFKNKNGSIDDINIIDLPELPQTEPPNDTLGIYMICHGRRIGYVQPNINGVVISKFNIAGPCGINYQHISKKRAMSSVKYLLYGWDIFPISTKEEFLTSDFINQYPIDGLDMENTYTNFYVNPPNGWACKLYTIQKDPNTCLAIAYKDKVIDLLRCSIDQLYAFIDIEIGQYEVDAHIYKILSTFAKGERILTTQQIFMLIKIMAKYKGITKVNIYDASCNGSEFDKQPEGTGYGGTRRRKKRYTSRKKNIK